MKKLLLPIVFLSIVQVAFTQNAWIRVNQIGYLPSDMKVAVLVSKDSTLSVESFEIFDALTDKPVHKSLIVKPFGAWGAFSKSFRLYFSSFTEGGVFYIKTQNLRSPNFKIGADVYDGTADFILRYLRQQRCGFNPLLKDSCHTHGGYVVYGDSTRPQYRDLAPFPIFGGWHDASDYLQYVTTTATTVYHLLFAYERHPSVFADEHQANGLAGKNGIPDVLDEAKWGLDWLVRLNPDSVTFFNQVCDDRDHRGMRMPHKDTFTYDIAGSRARPVYRITGQPQGLGKYKNRSTGVTSSVAKFASAFAAGARVLKPFYKEFADSLQQKALYAYEYALTDTGVCQTAPNRAPYFYEEDNWADDAALAALELSKNPQNTPSVKTRFSEDADKFEALEGGSKWLGKDTARHYQWYPFVNYRTTSWGELTEDKQKNMNLQGQDLEKLTKRSKNNPFLIGSPFIWCSNNYIAAALTQMRLYSNYMLSEPFLEVETAHRDWLFGCNPWGVTMMIGLPEWKNREGVSPQDPHSAFTHQAKLKIDGGLVDGPLYGSIYGKLIGLTLYQPDEYAAFQSKEVVFHDDYGDYSTNEPTMDGTASLAFYLATLQRKYQSDEVFFKEVTPQLYRNALKERTVYVNGNGQPVYRKAIIPKIDKFGATTRFNTDSKNIHLVFTGHEFAEGGNTILKTLYKHDVPASFFFTGDFLRNNKRLVKKLSNDGHYIGAHSDKHLLYCDWTKRDSLLVTKEQFLNDLLLNINELERNDVPKSQALTFMPSFEWYNDSIVKWANQVGFNVVNFTSGTSSNADYTTPNMKNYKSSQQIYDAILNYEKTDSDKLNGFILLLHIGAGKERTDKFFDRLICSRNSKNEVMLLSDFRKGRFW
jgi:endoglucanase